MKRLNWLVGPPAAGKTTWAARLRHQVQPPRILELAELLAPLVDPRRSRKGMMEAKGLLLRAIRRVELDPSNGGLPPLLVIVSLVAEEQLFPIHPDEEVLLLLPPRALWERRFLERTAPPAPGSRMMTLEEARGVYDGCLEWERRALPMTRVEFSHS